MKEKLKRVINGESKVEISTRRWLLYIVTDIMLVISLVLNYLK